MPSVMELYSAFKTMSQLKGFIESGEIAKFIGETELAAAKDALKKAKIAKDPRSQVWSAVNHLESAHQHFCSIHRKASFWDSPAKRLQICIAEHHDRGTLCYLATCYRFLGELDLCKQALRRAKQIPDYEDKEMALAFTVIGPAFLDPRYPYWLWKWGEIEQVDIQDVEILETQLLSLEEPSINTKNKKGKLRCQTN